MSAFLQADFFTGNGLVEFGAVKCGEQQPVTVQLTGIPTFPPNVAEVLLVTAEKKEC